jgi:hypothetical protein
MAFFRRLPDGGLSIIHIAAVCRVDGHVEENGRAALLELGGGRLTRKAHK